MIIYWTSSRTVAIALLWVVVPVVYFFIAPTLGLLQNVVRTPMRAQTIAILLFTANVANLVIAPQVVGVASDWLAPFVGRQCAKSSLVARGIGADGFLRGVPLLAKRTASTLRPSEGRRERQLGRKRWWQVTGTTSKRLILWW